MSSPPPPRPEGELIKRAAKRLRLSGRKAADLAHISEGRWRQIVNGYQTVSAGNHMEVEGPPATIAQMAHPLGISPEQLSAAGRDDAAHELRLLLSAEPRPAEVPAEQKLADLEPWQQQIILGALADRPRSKREQALLLRVLAEKMERQAAAEESRSSTIE
ncbi:hypothetical protein AB0P17_36360 [Streptomyces sp. NPDC088124]|uniref:hypothetical protein n=1 Tax=Streptomyces sp. NPDC088124 TaxID=3154654 RepID=UPI003425C9D5